jgi:hypothetical protein
MLGEELVTGAVGVQLRRLIALHSGANVRIVRIVVEAPTIAGAIGTGATVAARGIGGSARPIRAPRAVGARTIGRGVAAVVGRRGTIVGGASVGIGAGIAVSGGTAIARRAIT